MYYEDGGETCAAEKRVRSVSGQNVTTWSRDITSCCCMRVEAGTNGPQGGDWGHGNRVFLRLENLGGTGYYCKVDGNEFECPDSIELVLGGDCELDCIKDALRWWLSILEARTE